MIDQKEIESPDAHWKEIMDLAVKYGFITYAFGGPLFLQRIKTS